MTTKPKAKISASSQGGKVVPCIRCKGDIQPYAGRAVSLIGSHYAHHEGQCADRGAREAATHQTAQLELFAWSCGQVEPSYSGSAPIVCDVAGSDRTDYVSHMKAHGKRALSTEPIIKLRKAAPAAPRQAPRVPAFKRITWTVRHYAEWQPGIGNERLSDTQHVGQFWCNGAEANTVIVIEDRRRQGLPNRLVTLYLNGDGSLTADWSEAKSSRRTANRIAKYAA